MKISTKIISGYGILITLMAGLLGYQVFTIHRMQKIIKNIKEVNFDAAYNALEMRRDIDLVEEFTKKSFASDDPGYRDRLQEYCTNFETDLDNSNSARLFRAWSTFTTELSRQQLALQSQETLGVPGVLVDQLEQLKNEIRSAYQEAMNGINAEVSVFLRTSRLAETISWIVAAVALLLSALVSLLIVQSISAPLKQLTQGTRAITEGKFFYRLDTTRRDEFGQLAKDFNTMTHRLNELDQMKKDFVAHVSHELKVPLASMQETIQLLLEQLPGPLGDKQRRLLELNLASGQRLSAMIGNLLDLSRMEAGVLEYELKSNDLAGLARTAAAELQPVAGERDLTLELEVPEQPLMVECDGDRILQIIRNLLGNAVKFSPRGKAIRVRVARAPQIPAGMPEFWRGKVLFPADGKEFALVTVADSGPGVPDQHKKKIFEKFHQVKQGKKIPGQGAGLGLAISRTIAEAHRGALWVEDNPEGGSIFYLMIPPGESGGEVTYRASSPI
ncbi:MAG: HAMP domain-containing protein [Acidobacteriia bacterium]|nr:HAMP domain-containing protein [Terriglobia bacterium]